MLFVWGVLIKLPHHMLFMNEIPGGQSVYMTLLNNPLTVAFEHKHCTKNVLR